MRFSKVRDVKTPQRGTVGSAGIDFFIPNDIKWEKNFSDTFFLFPGCDILIPSGIHVDIPDGFALIAFNKSGIATKLKLQIGACVIDKDYQGEIHIHLTNIGTETAQLERGMKIAQFLLIPVSYSEIEEVPGWDLYTKTTQRADGGFGSTGIK